MRTLVSTFGDGDDEKVLVAMRSLAYDKLVLLSDTDMGRCSGLERIRNLEEMAGHPLKIESVGGEGTGFMELVEGITDILSSHSGGATRRDSVVLNISGGSKLLGDAALFAAFRQGIEAYHCEGNSVVRLPVLKGATAQDRFTDGQMKLIKCLAAGHSSMDEAMSLVEPVSRPSLERVVRDLRKAGVVDAELREGKVVLSLTGPGKEVANVLQRSSRAL